MYGMAKAVSASVFAAVTIEEPPSLVMENRRQVRLVVVPSEEQVTESKVDSLQEDDNLLDDEVAENSAVLTVDQLALVAPKEEVASITQSASANQSSPTPVSQVPFYSQFTDISSTAWQKVGCGIASLAMLIDFYSEESISVDALLQRGITAGAYLDSAGWIHSGLINLASSYGLTGESRSLSGLSMDDAFAALEAELVDGPVMASVHYTFEPTNPIPHLVVINGVKDGMVFYNDPAESVGGGSLSIDKFQRAWKKRYIEIHPI